MLICTVITAVLLTLANGVLACLGSGSDRSPRGPMVADQHGGNPVWHSAAFPSFGPATADPLNAGF